MFKIFMLLYADDNIVFSNSPEELQKSLDLLSVYCKRWKMSINVAKTKVMVFRKGGMLPRNLSFVYNGTQLEIVRSFKYLGIVFTVGVLLQKLSIHLQDRHKRLYFNCINIFINSLSFHLNINWIFSIN